jgi:hypothetical protein
MRLELTAKKLTSRGYLAPALARHIERRHEIREKAFERNRYLLLKDLKSKGWPVCDDETEIKPGRTPLTIADPAEYRAWERIWDAILDSAHDVIWPTTLYTFYEELSDALLQYEGRRHVRSE